MRWGRLERNGSIHPHLASPIKGEGHEGEA